MRLAETLIVFRDSPTGCSGLERKILAKAEFCVRRVDWAVLLRVRGLAPNPHAAQFAADVVAKVPAGLEGHDAHALVVRLHVWKAMTLMPSLCACTSGRP